MLATLILLTQINDVPCHAQLWTNFHWWCLSEFFNQTWRHSTVKPSSALEFLLVDFNSRVKASERHLPLSYIPIKMVIARGTESTTLREQTSKKLDRTSKKGELNEVYKWRNRNNRWHLTLSRKRTGLTRTSVSWQSPESHRVRVLWWLVQRDIDRPWVYERGWPRANNYLKIVSRKSARKAISTHFAPHRASQIAS